MQDLFYKPVQVKSKDHDVLFWGCLHYGHDPKWDVPIWKTRGYNSSAEHDEGLIQNWNSKANANTIGFLLGDTLFGYMGDERMLTLFNRLSFRELYVLPGNHHAGYKQLIATLPPDNVLVINSEKKVHFVPNYLEVAVNGQLIVCSHFPILSWNAQAKGSYHLFAHVHGNLGRSELGKMYLNTGLNCEVSVEVNPFPLTFGEIRAIMRSKKASTPDHH